MEALEAALGRAGAAEKAGVLYDLALEPFLGHADGQRLATMIAALAQQRTGALDAAMRSLAGGSGFQAKAALARR